MQSKKRFTEINIWEDPWFTDLSPTQKLFWIYLNHRADNIGVWTPNFKMVKFHLDIDEDIKKFEREFFEAIPNNPEIIKILKTGDWFLTQFVKFQYCKKSPLNPKNSAHRSYLELIEDRDLLEWFCENQSDVIPAEVFELYQECSIKPTLIETSKRPLGELSETYKEKEKEKEPDKEKDSEKEKKLNKETIDNRTLASIIERLLKLYPNPTNDVYFEEHNKCEDAIERLITSGKSFDEAINYIKQHLKPSNGNTDSLSEILDGIK